MSIEFIKNPWNQLVLTPRSKDVLRAIRQSMEIYYLTKYLELEDGLPTPPIPPDLALSNVGSRVGYTPHPDDPDPWPWPWPWPFPWWHHSNLSILESIVNGQSRQIGEALGDPYLQPNKFDEIKSNAFHLKAATAALEKMDAACGQLKENIARLQSQK